MVRNITIVLSVFFVLHLHGEQLVIPTGLPSTEDIHRREQQQSDDLYLQAEALEDSDQLNDKKAAFNIFQLIVRRAEHNPSFVNPRTLAWTKFHIAYDYHVGIVVEKDLDKALKLYNELLDNRQTPEQIKDNSRENLKKIIQIKYLEAATLFKNGASKEDLSKASRIFESMMFEIEKYTDPLDEKLLQACCMQLGLLYADGYGVEKNLDKATMFFKKILDCRENFGGAKEIAEENIAKIAKKRQAEQEQSQAGPSTKKPRSI